MKTLAIAVLMVLFGMACCHGQTSLDPTINKYEELKSLVGVWSISYNNRVARTYEIKPLGYVKWLNPEHKKADNGRLEADAGKGYVLCIDKEKLERFKLQPDGTLAVEQWKSKDLFRLGVPANLTGIGNRR